MKDKIDVMILCGGSATDLPVQTPKYAQWFNVVDSFDTHARVPEHFANVDKAASESNHVGIISVPEQNVCKRNPYKWKGLYILGQGCKPGTFRCNP